MDVRIDRLRSFAHGALRCAARAISRQPWLVAAAMRVLARVPSLKSRLQRIVFQTGPVVIARGELTDAQARVLLDLQDALRHAGRRGK